jgi:hypothetical protein
MPIDLISKIKPKNNGQFPVCEDVDLEGGFQVRVDLTDRDSIPALNRKIGMLVFVQSEGTYYTLIGGITNLDWVSANIGNGVVAETIPVTVDGQIIFNLLETPLLATAVNMYINGLRQSYGTDFTISTNVVTYIGVTSLLTSDKVDFWYISSGTGFSSAANIAIEKDSISVDPNTSTLNFTGNVTVTPVASGYVTVDVGTAPGSKIRVFSTVDESGDVVGTPRTATWDSISTIISQINASLTGGNTQLTTTQTGTFTVAGQLALQPTANSVEGITVDILRNGTIVNSVSDTGLVWAVGVTRSISFNFVIELSASDTVEVQWSHNGSLPSATQLMAGETISWFALDKLNAVTASAASAQDFIVTAVKTSLYTAASNELVQCNPTGGAFTINLPTAGGRNGKHIVVKNVSNSTNTITIQAAGLETIDGSSSQAISFGYESLHFVSNGSNWVII